MKQLINTFILSRTDSIGDVVLTLPVAGILKASFPDCKIIFLGKKYTQAVVECCEYVNEFADWDELSGMDKDQQLRSFTSFGADCIIHVFPNKQVASLAKRSAIPMRIGTSHRLFHWFTCNKLPNFTRKNSNLHESQLNLKLLSPLGLKSDYSLAEIQNYFGFRKIKTLPDEYRPVLDANRIKVILHPKSKGSAREWGIDNFSELIKILPENKFQVFVTGTKEEGDELNDFILQNPRLINMTGKLSLQELISFINNCDALVAASTGPLHLAAVLGKKAMGIYSPLKPIHPGRWASLGPNSEYLVADRTCANCRKSGGCDCLSSIKPRQVADKLMSLLK